MKKKLVCALIAIGIFSMVGCSEEEDKGNEANAKPQVEEQIETDSAKNEDEKDKGEANENKEDAEKVDTEKVDTEKNNIDKVDKENVEETNAKISKGEFAIYIGNENIDGVKVGTTIKTENLTIEENMKKIADEIAKKNFEGCSIELSKIKEEGNKKIVTVNLKDGTKKWERDYLQGSTGAFITEEILINSLLQPDNKVEWIDTIKFTINGKNVGELNHAPRIGQVVNRIK
ncbi:MAG: hypothetical protein ACRDDY_17305 [Clostridium sp.]|uniref:hypothetical protein n=1 Tax=Clostridium sp. TaxID=1506 RepID=UPI003EE77FC0